MTLLIVRDTFVLRFDVEAAGFDVFWPPLVETLGACTDREMGVTPIPRTFSWRTWDRACSLIELLTLSDVNQSEFIRQPITGGHLRASLLRDLRHLQRLLQQSFQVRLINGLSNGHPFVVDGQWLISLTLKKTSLVQKIQRNFLTFKIAVSI